MPLELRTFRFEELERATTNFKEILGEGKFGRVYKGWLQDPAVGPHQFPVAVKRLYQNSAQGQREWLAEIVILGRLRHPNLARLIGYCHDNGEGLLVYEFVSRGSLEFHLFQELNSGLVPLSWTARLKVALDAAQGLAYLHDQNIIHRDFKAPNILLGDKFEAKLTDFGLANKSITADVTTYIMDQEDHGVMRYLDPNLLDGTTGRVTQKSDVYSFGVVLLELLSGRRAVKPGCQLLTEWAEEALAERRPNIKAFMDPYIYEEFKTRAEGRAACILAIVAKHCIAKQPDGRPLMCEVVETLCQLVEG